jgi:hypothetical protein
MKDREYNDQKKKREESNELQKTKDWVTGIPLKPGRELMRFTDVLVFKQYARFYINLTYQQNNVISICIQFVSHVHPLQHASTLIPHCTPGGSPIRTSCITCSNGHLGLISIFCGLFQEFIDWWCYLIHKTFAHSLFDFTITVFVSRFLQRRQVHYNRQEQRKG